jgi:hypothetical protein
MVKTMRLVTLHGRRHPDRQMHDWGFVGPTIVNIVAVHGTYGQQNVYFASPVDALNAIGQTGWSRFGDRALIMRFYEDMLVLTGSDGRTGYYGDWEFQTQTGDGKPVSDPVGAVQGVVVPSQGATIEISIRLGRDNFWSRPSQGR